MSCTCILRTWQLLDGAVTKGTSPLSSSSSWQHISWQQQMLRYCYRNKTHVQRVGGGGGFSEHVNVHPNVPRHLASTVLSGKKKTFMWTRVLKCALIPWGQGIKRMCWDESFFASKKDSLIVAFRSYPAVFSLFIVVELVQCVLPAFDFSVVMQALRLLLCRWCQYLSSSLGWNPCDVIRWLYLQLE